MKRAVAATLLVLCLAAPGRAADIEDTNLKGRGWGRGVAMFWNKADKTTRRSIIIGISAVMVAGIGVGLYRFVKDTKASLAPREKQPWEGL